MKIFIETDRLILREVIAEDAAGFFELDSDPEVHKYLGNQPVKTIEESKAMIQDIHQQYQDNGIGRWAIIEKNTGEFVGWSGLKYETGVREDFDYYDIGYRLRRKYWGQGIGSETARESLKYGFTQMNLNEICAAADIDNIASNRILQKIGLIKTDTFLYNGIEHNWYQLQKSDWEKMPASK